MRNRFERACFLYAGQVSLGFSYPDIRSLAAAAMASALGCSCLVSLAAKSCGAPSENQVMRRAKLLVLLGYWCCVVETTTVAPRPTGKKSDDCDCDDGDNEDDAEGAALASHLVCES